MATYDKYYQEKNYFGDAYPELVTFFRKYPKKGKVLDLGCGQGRDALVLAKLGYDVTGIDISKVGINQMLDAAIHLDLNIKGEVKDIYAYDQINPFDVILLDSMLHFYPKDHTKETQLYVKILNDMKMGSICCNFLLKSNKNEAYIKSLVDKNHHHFEVIHDGYATYREANAIYHMFVIKKTNEK